MDAASPRPNRSRRGQQLSSFLFLCREKWCHMTQEEKDDSYRTDENITFGQLG